jgi:hypothetical protein
MAGDAHQEVMIGREDAYLLLSDIDDGESLRSGAGELSGMHAALALKGLRARTRVWLVWGVEVALANFFDDLAESWRGWEGEKVWESYEGGMSLRCTSDRLGHITVAVELREGLPTVWEARGDVPLEAGQLDRLAAEMRSFFSYG